MQSQLRFSNGNNKEMLLMRKVKLLAIGFLIIVCFLFGITLFLPSKVTVSKSIEINAAALDVSMQIQDFNNWKNWYPAFGDKDVTVTLTSHQNESVTHSAALRDREGHEILFNMLNQSTDTINVALQTAGKKNINYQFVISPGGKGYTLVVWNVNTNLGWLPWEKIEGIVLDKLTGPEYISGLQNLKKTVEAGFTQSHPK